MVNIAWGNTQTYTACPSVDAAYVKTPPQSARLSLVVMQHNLVILEQISPNHFKNHPVTFYQSDTLPKQLSEACAMTPIALVQGGDWGWHVLWQSLQGIYYARVDGEAWVSSVPKLLSKSQAVDVNMQVDKTTVTVQWKTTTNPEITQRAVSMDEGRSWN